MIEWCGRAASCSLGTEKPAETIYCTSSLSARLLSSWSSQRLSKLFFFFFFFFFGCTLTHSIIFVQPFLQLFIVPAMRDSFVGFISKD